MYKIMIHIETHTGDTWFYYQEDGKDYVANTLQEIKDTALTLIDVYGEDCIKIVKQETGDDMDGSVETFIYDSTDNYEELINRPSINGIEIVGELSLDALGIQPAGDYATREDLQNISFEDYATNDRVDQVEAKVDAIDLEPYATMDYLDEVVAGIDFSASNENITGVKTFSVLPRSTVTPITEDELTNKAYVDHEVLGCATEEYVNTSLDGYMPYIAFPNWVTAYGQVSLSSDNLPIVSKLITDNIGKVAKAFVQVSGVYASGIYFGKVDSSKPTSIKLYSYLPVNKSGIGVQISFQITGSWDGDVFTCTQAQLQAGQRESFLTSHTALAKQNTTAFTPTSDYHPATKKYVDDAVANASGEEDLSNYYTKGEVDALIPDDMPILKTYAISTTTNSTHLMDDSKVLLEEYMNKHVGERIYVYITSGNPGLEGIYSVQLPALEELTTTRSKSHYLKSGSQIYWYNNLYAGTFYFALLLNDTEDGYKISGNVSWERLNQEIFKMDDIVLRKANTTEFTPTGDYHPATKKYVDDSIAAIDIPTGSSNAIEQVETLPTASASNLGVVYQYVGNTNDTYTKGNYYVCVTSPRVTAFNDRIIQYVWANAFLSDLRKSIPLYTYMNGAAVYLTPGTHIIDSAGVKNQLSQIVKPYLNDYSPYIMLYCETSSSAGEYRKCLFTQNYRLDSSLYLEGDVTSILDPQKTAHVKMIFSDGNFDTYTYSGTITIIVTERTAITSDDYSTKEYVDEAIAAAITGALEGGY